MPRQRPRCHGDYSGARELGVHKSGAPSSAHAQFGHDFIAHSQRGLEHAELGFCVGGHLGVGESCNILETDIGIFGTRARAYEEARAHTESVGDLVGRSRTENGRLLTNALEALIIFDDRSFILTESGRVVELDIAHGALRTRETRRVKKQ